ncbi:UNVERIFIED_CONTAM: hypothetical protein GTU68_000491 [Idotea baltica]|nr:hypothetical protein [Idotea baltica]
MYLCECYLIVSFLSDSVQDPKGYLKKAIDHWSYADVIFFLMEACKDLNVNPGDVKFKSSDNGSVLLDMTSNDFEMLAPTNGQRFFDYFNNFKTQHYLDNIQQFHPSYNYNNNYQDCPPPEPMQYHPSSEYSTSEYHPHPSPNPTSQVPLNADNYQAMPSSEHPTYGKPHSIEYMPQGSQYMDSMLELNHQMEKTPRKSHELPSAAWKTFPPLHNYDENVSDPDEAEDEPQIDMPKKRGPGRPPKPESERKRKTKRTGRLWEFIRNLLLDPKTCPSMLKWENAQAGVFRIVQSDAIANKWGMRKNNEKMNYEKLSRAMRYYYKAKIFEPVLGKRLVYKFGCNAKGWRPLNPNNPNFQPY